jgi:adenosyl cobinamide kinase/adenosyl cobinamide phosphate guanylyltransferase
MGPRDPRVKQRGGSVSQPIQPSPAPGDSIQVNTTEKARSRVVAGRTEKPKSKPQDARTHEANQERAYVAASRRSDRSLEARIQSARLASEIHKKRTGKGFKITTEAVLNDAMYEEEEEPRTARLPYVTTNYQNFAMDQHYQRPNLEQGTRQCPSSRHLRLSHQASATGHLHYQDFPPRHSAIPNMATPRRQCSLAIDNHQSLQHDPTSLSHHSQQFLPRR